MFTEYAILYWAPYYESFGLEHRSSQFRDLMGEFFAISVILNASLFDKWMKLSHTYNLQLDALDIIRMKLNCVYARQPAPVFLPACCCWPFAGSLLCNWYHRSRMVPQECLWTSTNRYSCCFVVKPVFSKCLCGRDGSCCNEKDSQGRTPLFHGDMNGHFDIVGQLHASGALVDETDKAIRTPLSYAAKKGHTSICRFLLEHTAMVDSRSDKDHRTPLSYAAIYGHLDTVQLVHSFAADIEASECEGSTPLCCAAGTGMAEAVAYLLEQGVEIEKEDNHGQTILARAVVLGREATVKLLFAWHAAADQRDKCGHILLS